MTTAEVRESYSTVLRDAAAIISHYGRCTEAERDLYHPSETQDLYDTITDTTRVCMSGLGALALAQFPDADGWEAPGDLLGQPIEGWTGYHTVPVFALHLITQGMAEANEYAGAAVGAWCGQAGRADDEVIKALETAADMVDSGTIPIKCSACGAWFGWDAYLMHEQQVDQSVLDSYEGSWLILHDATAACPVTDDAHDRCRRELIAAAPAALLTGDE